MDIYDSVHNFMKMKNTGALLIVGAWGSGKTYYLENTVFKRLSEDDKKKCIRVSLFGVKDTSEIPYRVFQSYLDLTVKEKTSGAIQFEKVRSWVTSVLKSIPKLKDIVDLSPLFTKGPAAYALVPKETIICFDDIERATETLDINEILGCVNELVENRHFKVILVANKEYIDRAFQNKTSSDGAEVGDKSLAPKQSETVKELFFEKVVEKTLAFEPDIVSIYKTLVDGYDNAAFATFMNLSDQQEIVNPDRVRNKKYRKQLQNIRTLKFAIEHFYQIWTESENLENVSDSNSLEYKKMHNYWLFVHAVSVEQKAEKLNNEDDKGLSQAINFVERISLDDYNTTNYDSYDDEDDDAESGVDFDFVKQFKKRHFEAFNEPFVFYKSIYSFLTASKSLDMKSVNEQSDKAFNVQDGNINPANEILSSMLTKGFWSLTNEEVPDKLGILYDAVENGTFNDFTSYYNAGHYLFYFEDLLGKTEEEIKAAFTKGVVKLSAKMPEVSSFTKSQINILQSDSGLSQWMVKEMHKALDKRLADESKKAILELEQKYLSDLTEFVSSFMVTPNSTPAFFHVPILGTINTEKIKGRISSLEPSDVIQLYSLINERYIKDDSQYYKDELPFLKAIQEDVDSIDLEKKSLSNKMIEQYLKPVIAKAIERLSRI